MKSFLTNMGIIGALTVALAVVDTFVLLKAWEWLVIPLFGFAPLTFLQALVFSFMVDVLLPVWKSPWVGIQLYYMPFVVRVYRLLTAFIISLFV